MAALKLDWVEGVARLLADPTMLEEVEAEAKDIWQSGIRHIIWAGMGGSVLTVRVLCELGFFNEQDNHAIYRHLSPGQHRPCSAQRHCKQDSNSQKTGAAYRGRSIRSNLFASTAQ